MTRDRVANAVRLARGTSGVLVARLRQRTAPPASEPLGSWNRLFDRTLAARLRAERTALESHDVYLYRTLRDERVDGQIVFEYGLLVNAVAEWSGQRVLDLGTGRSTLPRWMASRGAAVIAFDYPTPVEAAIGGWYGRIDDWLSRAPRGVADVRGGLEALPFATASTDLVTCLSVLEHLDTRLADRTYVALAEQVARLNETLDEIVRVLRPGGLVYLTTECCDFTRATTDAWRASYYYRTGPALSGAWPIELARELFYDGLRRRGCEPVGPIAFDPAGIDDPRSWTWRGPYFSALSLFYRKAS